MGAWTNCSLGGDGIKKVLLGVPSQTPLPPPSLSLPYRDTGTVRACRSDLATAAKTTHFHTLSQLSTFFSYDGEEKINSWLHFLVGYLQICRLHFWAENSEINRKNYIGLQTFRNKNKIKSTTELSIIITKLQIQERILKKLLHFKES